MSAVYEVWDYESRNLINSFDTEVAARAFLQRLLELNGPDGVRELAIVRQVPDAAGEYEPTLLLEGAELLGAPVTHAAERSTRASGAHEGDGAPTVRRRAGSSR
jgi:hypothetical protein